MKGYPLVENVIFHSQGREIDLDFDFLSHQMAIRINDLSAQGFLLDVKLTYENDIMLESSLLLKKSDSLYLAKINAALDIKPTIALLKKLAIDSVPVNLDLEEIGFIQGRISVNSSVHLPDILHEKSSLKLLSNSQVDIDLQQSSTSSDISITLKTKEDAIATLLGNKSHDLTVSMPAIEFSLSQLEQGINLAGTLTSGNCRSITELACNAEVQLALNSAQLQYLDYSFSDLKISLLSKLTLESNTLSIEVLPGGRLEMSLNAKGIATVNKIQTANLEPAYFTYQLPTKKFGLQSEKISLLLSGVESILQGGEKLSSSSKLTLNGMSLVIDENFSASGLLNGKIDDLKYSANPKMWLPNLGFTSSLSIYNSAAKTSGVVNTDTDRQLFAFKASYDTATAKGTAEVISDDIQFNENSDKLSAWFSNWDLAGDIIGGTLHINSELAFDLSKDDMFISGSLKQKLENINAYYQETVIAGLSTQFEAELVKGGNIKNITPSKLTIETIDAGIEIKDIAVEYTLNTSLGHYRFDNVEAKLLGGKISTDAFNYNINAESVPINVRFNSIDIEQVLEQGNFKGVSCTGLVSGYLPFHLSNEGVSVVDGILQSSQDGGVLRYTIDGQSADKELRLNGDIQTQIVNQILSNYHYDKLQANVNYLSQQDRLILSINMQGQNPDMGKSGLAANFNPTIETSVLPLLKAQSVSVSVIERLEKALAK